MKKLSGLLSISILSFTFLLAPAPISASDVSSFACCSAQMTDPSTGEVFDAITVCSGGNSAEDHIAACLEADAWLDAFLSLLE